MAHVLIVDDYPDTCELLAKLLRRVGYDAHCQTSAADAIRFLDSRSLDLLIVDVTMPQVTGLELLKHVRAHPKTMNMPVIVYTALSDEKTRKEAERLGASGYVVKGTGWVELQAEIVRLLGRAGSRSARASGAPSS